MKKFNINQFKPCLDAAKYYDACKSSKEAWNNCPRGDWMLWIALKLGVNIKILTLAKVHCALTMKHLIKDKRSIKALEVALKFANNKATLKELKIAANVANVAADAAADDADVAAYVANTAADAAADAAAHAADVAAYAADAAADAADVAAYAANTANAAADAAAYAVNAAANAAYDVADAAKIKNQLKTANVCRKYLTKPVFKILSFYNNEKIQYKSI